MGSCDHAGYDPPVRDAWSATCSGQRRTRIAAALIAVGAILFAAPGAHAESAAKNAWSLFSSLSLKFFEKIAPHPAYSIVAGWALQVIGQQIGPGGGTPTDPAVLAALGDIKQQIYKRSHGRFFRPRWKLFGRIPFEWVSLGTIIAMLIYYIAVLHGSPSGVRPAP